MASLSAAPARAAKVLGLVGAAHFMSHVYSLALPPLFPLLAGELGVSFTALGLLFTAQSLAAAVATTPVGFVVDRLGGRRVLTYGLAAQAAAMCAVGFAGSYWTLLALYIVAGLAFSVYHPADYAILSGSVAEGRLGRAFSIHSFLGNVGSAVVPMVMVTLAALWDWRMAFIAIGAFGVILALFIATQRELLVDDAERARRPSGRDEAADDRKTPPPLRDQFMVLMVPPVMMGFLFYVVSNMGIGGLRTFAVSSLVALYGTPLAAANGALTGFLVGSSAGILVGGLIADRLGPRMITAVVGLVSAAALLFVVGAVSMPITLIVGVLTAAGLMRAVVQATRDLVVLSVTPRGSTGKVFAFVTNGSMVGAAIVPLLFGWVMDRGEAGWVFWLAGGFMLVSLATFLGVKRLAPDRARR